MPNYRCCVGGCDNDSRYPEKVVKRSHVAELKFHCFPKDEARRKLWKKQVDKGLAGFVVTNNKVVCSNHFEFGKPTYASPIPTLFMTMRKAEEPSPRKRRKINYKKLVFDEDENKNISTLEETSKNVEIQCSLHIPSAMVFADLTRDIDVNYFTGFKNRDAFNMVFKYLSNKARTMHYWKGLSNTSGDLSSPRELKNVNLRSLTLEQEFLLTMMRLRLGLLTGDLANRFKVSNSLVSTVFTTWVRLMSLELRWLINWPNRNIIRRNLPSMFRKYYPNCCVIIDCSELFIETPSSLDEAAAWWSNYKHHHTVKYLIGITPNGTISYLSDCYGGRATDVFIVRDSGFLQKLQPPDQVMADRGFKIQDMLAFYQCTLAIPPSKHTNIQMTATNIQKTSRIANVRIYVEQAIARMKTFRILKHELPISLLPFVDDIVLLCAIMTNFMEPLCSDDN